MLPKSGVEAVLASNGISIPEDLPSDTAANCARDRISKRAKINILGCACDDISADWAAYELYDQINENCRDRNRARLAVGEGFPFLLFRLQDGFTVSPWRTFPEAPL
jgi:hypothetical protein